MSYVIACYAITALVLGIYAVHLRVQRRGLRRLAGSMRS